jgi:hypothetical protein
VEVTSVDEFLKELIAVALAWSLEHWQALLAAAFFGLMAYAHFWQLRRRDEESADRYLAALFVGAWYGLLTGLLWWDWRAAVIGFAIFSGLSWWERERAEQRQKDEKSEAEFRHEMRQGLQHVEEKLDRLVRELQGTFQRH